MKYEVHIVDVPIQLTAVVRDEATVDSLARKIRDLYDELFKHIDAADVGKRGLNIIFYPASDWSKPFPIEVGVQVHNPFPDADRIVCSEIPNGRAVTAVHVGPYEHLPKAHAAVKEWCTDRGRELTGDSWEVYGGWQKDPNHRSCEIYYLLK